MSLCVQCSAWLLVELDGEGRARSQAPDSRAVGLASRPGGLVGITCVCVYVLVHRERNKMIDSSVWECVHNQLLDSLCVCCLMVVAPWGPGPLLH